MKAALTVLAIICMTNILNAQSNDELQRLYSQGRYDEVIRNSSNALENEPNNPIVNMVVGRAFADKMKFADAMPYLKTAVSNDKSNSWPKAWALVYLGKCYFATGKYEESAKSIDECITMNATKNVTNAAVNSSILFGIDKSYGDWVKKETDHFAFHFQPLSLKGIKDTDNYTKKREAAFQIINEYFGCTLPKKIDFFVWHSRDDMKVILKSPGGFSRPEYCIVHTWFDQTPGHEITHIISNYLPNITEKTVLINEGTAVYFDQTNRNQLELARKTMKEKGLKTISLKEIWNNRTLSEEVLYPLGGAFIKHLIDTEGKGKFIELFKNQTYENAKKVYGDNFEQIIVTFEKNLFED